MREARGADLVNSAREVEREAVFVGCLTGPIHRVTITDGGVGDASRNEKASGMARYVRLFVVFCLSTTWIIDPGAVGAQEADPPEVEAPIVEQSDILVMPAGG